jgi:hypothetical protein
MVDIDHGTLIWQFIAAGTAAFFGGQPLLISGVTGEHRFSVIGLIRRSNYCLQ